MPRLSKLPLKLCMADVRIVLLPKVTDTIRLIKNAGFAISTACIKDIKYHPDRKLDKAQITRLAACNYIQGYHNIIIPAATGSGKTFISCSLGMAASPISTPGHACSIVWSRFSFIMGRRCLTASEDMHNPWERMHNIKYSSPTHATEYAYMRGIPLWGCETT
ncbi:ATP-binding protein [Pelotomaculum schinkii]|uniref:ATP-binding protein n=1 Tax=Pelotomaculum schinkii TaxID=78350 RepID=UPI001FA9A633|nr:ATP-binding protein [Pelotomaculum schinkii]